MAKLFWHGERDLHLIERSEEKVVLLQIIIALRDDVFDIEPGEEDNYESWNQNKASAKTRADKEQAEVRKAKLAANAAVRARQNQKQEAKMVEIIHTAREGRTGKRTASLEIPESAKGADQERKGKGKRQRH